MSGLVLLRMFSKILITINIIPVFKRITVFEGVFVIQSYFIIIFNIDKQYILP